LNQSYEPLTICNIKKAIVLILLGKAELISKDSRKIIHSIRTSYAWPSVIRLRCYVTVPYKRVVLTRKNVLRRDLYRCGYCGRGDLPLTIDHILPKAKGGEDSWENLVSACTVCNNKKGDRTPHQAEMKLITKPYKPSHLLFLKNSVGKLDDSWKRFLYQN
jgi:5-methylcytosine-specific restriction endonuclease McrA